MTQDVNIIQSQIERLPWIKQASVRKQWPDELKIHLVEYVPIARWNDQHMVDVDGNSFSVPSDRVNKQNLPMLYGPEGSENEVLQGFREMGQVLAKDRFYVKRCCDDGAPFTAVDLNEWHQAQPWPRRYNETSGAFCRTLPGFTAAGADGWQTDKLR